MRKSANVSCCKNREGNTEIYLDELTSQATYALLRARGISKVTVLDAVKPGQEQWRWLLGKAGIHVLEASFFTGKLRTAEGESVFLKAQTLAGEIAIRAARKIVQSDTMLTELNERYESNTIISFVTKTLVGPIEYWTKRVLVAQALSEQCGPSIWLKRPLVFDENQLVDTFASVDLCFYTALEFSSLKIAKMLLLEIARDIKFIAERFLKPRTRFDFSSLRKPSVLLLQEDTLRSDRSLRGQPHWLSIDHPAESFHTYVVTLVSKFSVADDASQLIKSGVTILPAGIFRLSVKYMRHHKTLLVARQDRRIALRKSIFAQGFVLRHTFLHVAILLWQAQLMGALALCLNTRVFLIRETYYSFADAMQLVARDLNIITVAYQYSSPGSVSPLMLSTADKFLLFSDMYHRVFSTVAVMPKEFLVTGYVYDGIADLVRDRARTHRDALVKAGARFVVCFFDESVQKDRWGLVSQEHHLGELHALARKVVTDPEFGLVVKSQFVYNSPSRLYPADELIHAAKATGRYIELIEGAHRNDIYPTEAALAADLCIGHKFGATAPLEAAIAGVRTVLLDSFGARTLWDGVYAKADVEYGSMETLLDAIALYRSGEPTYQAIGDWSAILYHFDPYWDGQAVYRLRNVVKELLNA